MKHVAMLSLLCLWALAVPTDVSARPRNTDKVEPLLRRHNDAMLRELRKGQPKARGWRHQRRPRTMWR